MDENVRVRKGLFEEIKDALEGLGGWGSVEIFVQDSKVTQITGRKIRKTNHSLEKDLDKNNYNI